MIAALLGLMTLITFGNVLARYVFNDNILQYSRNFEEEGGS